VTTRLNGLDDKTAGTDSFGLTNYDKLQADADYVFVPGADIAALDTGNTVTISARYHKVTVATGNIDNITDPLGAVAGQVSELAFTNAQTVRNNSGGSSTVRTASGADVVYGPGTVASFRYDGTNWVEQGRGTGAKLDYAQIQTPGNSIPGNLVPYDGSEVRVEVWAPSIAIALSGGSVTITVTKDGSSIGASTLTQGNTSGTGSQLPCHMVIYDTPTSGNHTYSVATSQNMQAGAGGSGSPAAFIRVTKA